MTRSSVVFGIACLLLGVSGCGGPASGILRDGTNIFAELVDALRKVVDEDSAKVFTATHGKRLQEKWENHKKRIETFARFGEDQDIAELAVFWLADQKHNKNKAPGPISLMLESQLSALIAKIESTLKGDYLKDGKEWPLKSNLTKDDLVKGVLVVKRADEFLDQKGPKQLIEESTAARALLDLQVKRLQGIRPQEPSGALPELQDPKKFLNQFMGGAL